MKGLERFKEAQELTYKQALQEIQNGKKTSHWIWFIFPQIKGLGYSYNSCLYGIQDIEEAREYLCDDVLGKRLIEISQALLDLKTSDAFEIFGDIDSIKLKSCMTLFSIADPSVSVFKDVLTKFYGGSVDCETVRLLQN